MPAWSSALTNPGWQTVIDPGGSWQDKHGDILAAGEICTPGPHQGLILAGHWLSGTNGTGGRKDPGLSGLRMDQGFRAGRALPGFLWRFWSRSPGWGPVPSPPSYKSTSKIKAQKEAASTRTRGHYPPGHQRRQQLKGLAQAQGAMTRTAHAHRLVSVRRRRSGRRRDVTTRDLTRTRTRAAWQDVRLQPGRRARGTGSVQLGGCED